MSNQSSTTAASTPTVEEYEAQGFGARYRTLRDGRFGVVIQSGEDEALGLAKDEEVTVLVLKRDGTVNRERVKPIHAGEDFMLCGILQTLDRGAGGSANPASERQRKAIERMFARLDEHDPGTAQEIRTRHLDAVGSPEELSIQGASALLDALDQALGPPRRRTPASGATPPRANASGPSWHSCESRSRRQGAKCPRPRSRSSG